MSFELRNVCTIATTPGRSCIAASQGSCTRTLSPTRSEFHSSLTMASLRGCVPASSAMAGGPEMAGVRRPARPPPRQSSGGAVRSREGWVVRRRLLVARPWRSSLRCRERRRAHVESSRTGRSVQTRRPYQDLPPIIAPGGATGPGRGAAEAVFARDPARSLHTFPQRLIGAGLWRGVDHLDPAGVTYAPAPGVGEVFECPFLSQAGRVRAILVKAAPRRSSRAAGTGRV